MIQRLFDARVRILIGRADPSDYVGAYWLQNVNNSFVNRHFSANPAVSFPGHGPLLGVSIRPTDLYYITAGACIVDQNLMDKLQVFARYAYSDGTLTNVRHLAQAGLGFDGLSRAGTMLTGAVFPRLSRAGTARGLKRSSRPFTVFR